MKRTWTDFLAWSCEHEQGGVTPHEERLENGVNVQVWDSGVMVIEPAKPGGKDVVISCAVHGDETAPIEMVRDIAQDILTGKLEPCQRVLLLIANPAAINIGKRFVDENMNRLFSGAHKNGNTPEHKRAGEIEQYVARFFEAAPKGDRERYHYDLHTAIRESQHEKFAVYPFTHGRPYKKEQLSFLRYCGVDTILLNQAPTTTFSYFSVNEFGADAFTVELGQVKPFGENDMSRFAEADKAFRELISQPELDLPEFSEKQHTIYEVCRTINREQEAFKLNFPDDVANFTPFQQGYLIAQDGDTEHYIEQSGERIIFPNAKVKIGQRALLLVVEIPAHRLELI